MRLPPMVPRERLGLALAMIVALAGALLWLQGRFDGADVRTAIRLAMGHRAEPGGRSVFDALVARGEGDPRCDGEIVSFVLGDVRVSCATPARPEVRYEFRVLLDGRRAPRAESAAAREVMGR